MMQSTSCVALDWVGMGLVSIGGFLMLAVLLLAVLALGRYVFFSPGRQLGRPSATHE